VAGLTWIKALPWRRAHPAAMADASRCRIRADRIWVNQAIGALQREAAASVETALLHARFDGYPGIDFHFKDESAHPSGSLKHRLARSLFLYALCSGELGPGQPVFDASSGSTAISEAWFARLLGLQFTAVVPETTAPAKLRELRALGAEVELASRGGDCALLARGLARRAGGCFLDQFGRAGQATDWRGNNNIAESIIGQMRGEAHPQPAWIVCGAGTGGTSATIGRYLRYRALATRLCVAEPSNGAFALGWRGAIAGTGSCSLIEGIGRPRIEPGFMFTVVDAVVEVDDSASCAAAHVLAERFGRRFGGSSGTNLIACLRLAAAMVASGERGSIVTLLCDGGERYTETVFDPRWLARHLPGHECWRRGIERALGHGGAPQPAAPTR
jgi:cysteine synthase A